MLAVFKPGTRYDFVAMAPTFFKISVVSFVVAIILLLVHGVNFGLDFAGGHEILLEFEKPVKSEDVRARLERLNLGDTSVQSYAVPDTTKTYYLVRVERSATFGESQIAGLTGAFKQKYGEHFERLRYNPEAGDVVEVEFTASSTIAGIDTSSAALGGVVAGTNHDVRLIRSIGRPDKPKYSIVLKGVDVSVLKAMREDLDPAAMAPRVEFVGPTAGKQLRDEGLLAVFYALLCMLIYIALRFDFFYSPGAVLCLFHDAILTVAIIALLGEEFSLATIAGLLTLVGYSINDTIIVFDRIRETVGKAQGEALKDIINRATNETLNRTFMTGVTTLLSCIALMFFGRGTVLASFGLIMLFGVVFGTYSSWYVAAPIFMYLRTRFGPKQGPSEPKVSKAKKSSPGGSSREQMAETRAG